MPRKWILINLAWVFLTLNACGWQLRNSQLLADNLGTVHISYSESQTPLVIELRRALKANNVQLVGATAKANYWIKIIDIHQSRRISAVNASARAAQYQMHKAVDFTVLDGLGTTQIPMTTAIAESTYNFNELDVLASKNEELLLQDNLRLEIVRQIIHRLDEVSDNREGFQ